MEQCARGVGKCGGDHLGSFGYPTRPDHPYGFCSQCGGGMAWQCPSCHAVLPEDPDELKLARFCRDCGASYFGEELSYGPQLRVVNGEDEPVAADRAG